MISEKLLPGRSERLLALAVAILAVMPRTFYLNVPFERDEGAYAYMAEVISRGGLPYLNAFDHKPPLVYYIYYLSFQLFGHTLAAPRLLALLFVSVASLLTLLLVYRLTRNQTAAILSCLLLGLASSSPAYLGFSANTELFALPFLAGGVLLLADKTPSLQQFFWAGLVFGTGIMVKQPVAAVALAAGVYHAGGLLRQPRRTIGSACLFAGGLLLPLAFFCLYFAGHDGFAVFWDSFYTYNVSYVQKTGFAQSLQNLEKHLRFILDIELFTWLAGLLGLLVCFVSGRNELPRWYIGLVLAGSVAATSMGGNYYPHYFIFMLPVLVVGTCVGAALLSKQRPVVVRYGMAILLLVTVALNGSVMAMSTRDLLKLSYGDLPFAQAKVVGDFLRSKSAASATAYIIGSEPEILFYAGLRAPSRYFYFYPLVWQTPHAEAVRSEVLADLERQPPEIMIYVNSALSTGVCSTDDRERLRKVYGFFSTYRLVALSTADSNVVICGDGHLAKELITSGNVGAILIFERNPAILQVDQPTFGSILGV